MAGLSAPGELQRGDLVVSACKVRHGYAVPALCGNERGERAVSTEHLVKVSSQFRGWPRLPAAQVRDVAGIAGHAARYLTHPKTARLHQALQFPTESTHETCNPIPRAFAPRCLFGIVRHTPNALRLRRRFRITGHKTEGQASRPRTVFLHGREIASFSDPPRHFLGLADDATAAVRARRPVVPRDQRPGVDRFPTDRVQRHGLG